MPFITIASGFSLPLNDGGDAAAVAVVLAGWFVEVGIKPSLVYSNELLFGFSPRFEKVL